MPLERIVEQVLMVSDNDGAEVLFRQVAVAGGRPGSTARRPGGAGRAAPSWACGPTAPGSSTAADWPGENRVPAPTLVRLLRLAAEEIGSELRAV